jgi:hypothetical protein
LYVHYLWKAQLLAKLVIAGIVTDPLPTIDFARHAELARDGMFKVLSARR